MPFFTYILRCQDGTYYTGHTDDLDARVAQHAAGEGCKYTAKRLPVQLIWAADCQSRAQAFELEKQLQGWSRKKKEALMRGDFAALPGLSRSRGSSNGSDEDDWCSGGKVGSFDPSTSSRRHYSGQAG